jgi:hypothetical protein
MEYLILPANVPDQVHWVLLVIHIPTLTIYVYDSLGGRQTALVEKTIIWFIAEHLHKRGTPLERQNIKVVRHYTHQTAPQKNGTDCGLFVILTAELLALGIPLNTITQAYVLTFRRTVAYALTDGKAPALNPLLIPAPQMTATPLGDTPITCNNHYQPSGTAHVRSAQLIQPPRQPSTTTYNTYSVLEVQDLSGKDDVTLARNEGEHITQKRKRIPPNTRATARDWCTEQQQVLNAKKKSKAEPQKPEQEEKLEQEPEREQQHTIQEQEQEQEQDDKMEPTKKRKRETTQTRASKSSRKITEFFKPLHQTPVVLDLPP